jgi:hypothetical protein
MKRLRAREQNIFLFLTLEENFNNFRGFSNLFSVFNLTNPIGCKKQNGAFCRFRSTNEASLYNPMKIFMSIPFERPANYFEKYRHSNG